ncbi:MAG: SsrA-binding protein SmpB [Alphaproteobacteria bacterium]|nr:SsrA-binding protein SmpB [Alphaproteobacteria bacterium]
MAKKAAPDRQIAAQNRKARHDYFIDENIEAGLVLEGSEVKSLRSGQGSLVDAWAGERDGELWMFSAYIPQYASSHEPNYVSRRPRKLLLHKREVSRLLGAIQREGVTLVPLSIYFNERGIAKVDIGIARGKRKYDKRQTEKKRDWDRQKSRLLRDNR